MATRISHSAEETFQLGVELAGTATRGLVFGLTGDLGSGKTQLVKGLAHGLGIRARLQSPTFSLVHEYHDGTVPLFHLDLYRLESSHQIVAAGLEEYFSPRDGIAVIEWFERWEGPPPPRLCRIHLRHEAENSRRIDYHHEPARD